MSRCIGPSLVVLLLMSLSFIMASREEILVKFKNSEEKYRHVVENATNLFYSHDTDHVLTYISPRCREFFQCEPEEAMVRWTEFLTGNPINPRGFELTQKAIETGTPQKPHELELIGKKGKKIIVEVNEAPVLKNGKTIGIVGSLTDITDRKETEKALVKERDSLAHALAEIKTLRGILPICSICKQIRDDQGYWNNLETYLSKHSMADFTHSICPKCAKEHYPDLDIYD